MIQERLGCAGSLQQFEFAVLFSSSTAQGRKARHIQIIVKIVHSQVVLIVSPPGMHTNRSRDTA